MLCTVEDQAGLLSELRRVVRPEAKVGLLVFLRTARRLPHQPDGNHFPTADEFDALLDGAGLAVREQAELADFGATDPDWQAMIDRVDTVIERKHRMDRRWQTARQQEQLIAGLISEQLVIGRLVAVRPG